MKRECIRIAGVISISMLLLLTAFSSVANAWTTENLYALTFDYESWFSNYDFESEDASSDNVDWAVSVMFWGPEAEVDNAKELLWVWTGTTMKIWYNDGDGTEYDSDRGRKSDPTDLVGWHARLYAPSDTDRFVYDPLDYFVVATTHKDWMSHWPFSQTGYTSETADKVIERVDGMVGEDNVWSQFVYVYNYEPYREEGNVTWRHVWEHDGWARGVYMD